MAFFTLCCVSHLGRKRNLYWVTKQLVLCLCNSDTRLLILMRIGAVVFLSRYRRSRLKSGIFASKMRDISWSRPGANVYLRLISNLLISKICEPSSLREQIWDLRRGRERWVEWFEIYPTDESGSWNKSLELGGDGDSCRKLVSVFGRGDKDSDTKVESK